MRGLHVRAIEPRSPQTQPEQLDLGFDAQPARSLERPGRVHDRRADAAVSATRCIQRGAELLDETLLGLDVKRDNVVHPVGYF